MDPEAVDSQPTEGVREGRSSSVVDLSGATIYPEKRVEDADRDVEGSDGSGGGASSATASSASQHRRSESGDVQRQKSDAPSIMLPNQQRDISHLAIDIGGTLVKLVYFSLQEIDSLGGSAVPIEKQLELAGRLHFVKFESNKIDDCIDFIENKGLHQSGIVVHATGGGAYKFAELFEERLGMKLVKEDEMVCLVTGTNFLLRAIRDETFTFENGVKNYCSLNTRASSSHPDALFPYLLVNIGSGVSMIKVDSNDSFERISGSSLGGGAFWGLCALLTGCRSFDEMLELTMHGDSSRVDMLVGDIYGGRDYSSIGLSADTIASSFGKVVMEGGKLQDYQPQHLALSLLRMVSYNISQIAYLNAKRYGLKRILFGGYFIRGHQQTMETISYAIHFWSKGEMMAHFMRHEGFLGALGAFIRGSDIIDKYATPSGNLDAPVWIERFPIGAPLAGGVVKGPPLNCVDEKVSWLEKFVMVSAANSSESPNSQNSPMSGSHQQHSLDINAHSSDERLSTYRSSSLALYGVDAARLTSAAPVLGVLHLCPSLRPFPLLLDPENYLPDSINLMREEGELEYWKNVLLKHLPTLVDHAIKSNGGTEDATRRAKGFELALKAHLERLTAEPASYGNLGLTDLLELREECLREFQFRDSYKPVKDNENAAALQVFQDLIAELDEMSPVDRLPWLLSGMLAANIFDWGAMACVEMYQDGSILYRYRESRAQLCSQRPFLIDDIDQFIENLTTRARAYRRAVIFVDNSGADVVLGILPFARELIRLGSDVILAANTDPAINDVTAAELRYIVAAAATHCDILAGATRDSLRAVREEMRSFDSESTAVYKNSPSLYIIGSGNGGPCIDLRRVSVDLSLMCEGADLIILEGMGRAIHTNYHAKFSVDAIKLAMLKNERLAKRFNGRLYDCIFRFEPKPSVDPELALPDLHK